ncbi:MAG: pyrroline-5-carboxylate reductase [Phycisphaerales bacterium]
MPQPQPVSLVVIGGGKMARALLAGAILAGVITPNDVAVADTDPKQLAVLRPLGVRLYDSATAALQHLTPDGQLLLAVKPQSLSDVARETRNLIGDRVLISILAGAPSARIREAFDNTPRVIRVMPNLAAQVRRGLAAISLGSGARPADDAFASRLFSAVGETVTLDESLMDAFTALAGSGPAYLFFLAEALDNAAQQLGFSPECSSSIVRHTLSGAAELLLRAPESTPLDLRLAVTSKGGTTEAAVRVLQDSKVLDAVIRAVLAARDRGVAIANAAS